MTPWASDADGEAIEIHGDLAAASLASLGAFGWTVPTLVVSVPGLLLIVAIGAQMLGGLAWLPLVRRKIGGFGLAGRRRTGKHPSG